MVAVSLSFIIENALTAIIIIGYLSYEIYFGRLNRMVGRLEGVVDAVIALAREHDDIDEEEVKSRVNGSSPKDFIKDD